VRIAVLNEPGRFELVDEPVPSVGPDDLLVRVSACGVCTSELDMWQGRTGHAALPWYPGHEVSGVVERIGDRVVSFHPGDPVVAWVTTRGYAEYVAVRADHCLPADGLPLDVALAEPMACAVNAVDLASPALGDDVVIVGAGFMGNLVHLLVNLQGSRQVIIADVRAEALERAARLGATATVNMAEESLPDRVMELTGGAGADMTFEVTGVPAVLPLLGEVTRMSGTVVIAGYHQGEAREIPLGRWNWMAFRIVNAHFREVSTILRGMRMGMRLLTSGRVSLDGLVTHRFPLERIDEAFRTALEKPAGFVKATVQP
jgi:L-iditol 2-dehydrogenase